jgi:hypothetical protein
MKMRMAKHVKCTAKIRNVYLVLMRKTAGKRPFG